MFKGRDRGTDFSPSTGKNNYFTQFQLGRSEIAFPGRFYDSISYFTIQVHVGCRFETTKQNSMTNEMVGITT